MTSEIFGDMQTNLQTDKLGLTSWNTKLLAVGKVSSKVELLVTTMALIFVISKGT